VDSLSPSERSEIMARVRSKNSRPELAVRKLAFGLGYRYRLHARELPGCPDLVFRPRHKVIFVHGCFWHRHPNCVLARMPKSRLEFWGPKLEGNHERDDRNKKALAREGWKVLTIWECELRDAERLKKIIRRFLDAER
jgi:DNA mismatch endonuclease (patch repair protein)